MREGEDDGDAVETGAVVEGGDVGFAGEDPVVVVSRVGYGECLSGEMEMEGGSTYHWEDFFSIALDSFTSRMWTCRS